MNKSEWERTEAERVEAGRRGRIQQAEQHGSYVHIKDRFKLRPDDVEIAYLCHPYIGDPEGNAAKAAALVPGILSMLGEKWYVFVPHVLGVNVPNGELTSMAFCQKMVVVARLIVVGSDAVSAGMSEELFLAQRLGKRVVKAVVEEGRVVGLREYKVLQRS